MTDVLTGIAIFLLSGIVFPWRWSGRSGAYPGVTTAGFAIIAITVWLIVGSLPRWQLIQVLAATATRVLPPTSEVLFYALDSSLSQFLHRDALHLIGNLLWFVPLGMRIESVIGSWRFAAVLLLIAMGQYLVWWVAVSIYSGAHWWEISQPVIGSSGIGFALMGLVLVVEPRARIHSYGLLVFFPWAARIPLWFLVAYMLQQNLFLPKELTSFRLISENDISQLAHVFGFVIGMLLGFVYRLVRRYPLLMALVLPPKVQAVQPSFAH